MISCILVVDPAGEYLQPGSLPWTGLKVNDLFTMVSTMDPLQLPLSCSLRESL